MQCTPKSQGDSGSERDILAGRQAGRQTHRDTQTDGQRYMHKRTNIYSEGPKVTGRSIDPLHIAKGRVHTCSWLLLHEVLALYPLARTDMVILYCIILV